MPALARVFGGDPAAMLDAMPPVVPANGRRAPQGYRALGPHALRIDMAEKLLREAHHARMKAGRRAFALDPARAVSMGLTTASYARLLRLGGFQPIVPRPLAEAAHGPPAPLVWRWRPPRAEAPARPAAPPRVANAFAELAELVR